MELELIELTEQLVQLKVNPNPLLPPLPGFSGDETCITLTREELEINYTIMYKDGSSQSFQCGVFGINKGKSLMNMELHRNLQLLQRSVRQYLASLGIQVKTNHLVPHQEIIVKYLPHRKKQDPWSVYLGGSTLPFVRSEVELSAIFQDLELIHDYIDSKGYTVRHYRFTPKSWYQEPKEV